MIAYKLFRQRKDGSLGPVFINRRQVIRRGVVLEAEAHRTKGYAFRPGWHCTAKPHAPHLSMKGRVWARVYIDDYEPFHRPQSQGGLWYLAKKLAVHEVLTPEQVTSILEAGA